jgi:nucleoside-diphosphate-sugar epimerase
VVKKGTETRDWTYVDDIIDGLLAMGIKEEAVGEAINLGSGKEHRVIDMANMVNALTGNEAGIRYVERRDWDVKTRLLLRQDYYLLSRRQRSCWITNRRWNLRKD